MELIRGKETAWSWEWGPKVHMHALYTYLLRVLSSPFPTVILELISSSLFHALVKLNSSLFLYPTYFQMVTCVAHMQQAMAVSPCPNTPITSLTPCAYLVLFAFAF